MAHSGSPADDSTAPETPARLRAVADVRAVRTRLQLDGPGRHRARRIRHRRGTADVPGARRRTAAYRRVRQPVSRWADDVRPAATVVRDVGPPRRAHLDALPGATDAIHPVRI